MAVRNVAVWNGAAQNLGTDQANVNNGSSSAPGLVFGSDANTGLFRDSNVPLLGASVDGILCMQFLQLGNHVFGHAGGQFDAYDYCYGLLASAYQYDVKATPPSDVPYGNTTGIIGQAGVIPANIARGVGVAGLAGTTALQSAATTCDDLFAFNALCEAGSGAGNYLTCNRMINFNAMTPLGTNVNEVYGYYCEDLTGVGSSVAWAFYSAGSTKSYFGNTVQIGTTTTGDGTNVLVIADGTAPSSNIANSCQVYTDSGDLYCRTPGGSVVKLTGAIPPQVSITRTSGEAGGTVIKTGMVVYSSSNTQVKRSRANSLTTKDSVGFSITVGDVASGGTIAVQTDGIVTLSDWSAVAETPSADLDLNGGNYELLKAGKVYYCSSASDGKITITPPSGSGTYVAPVGLAISTTEMLVYTSLAQVVATTPSVATTRPNSLINGGFDLFQRTDPTIETAIADNAYGPDRWVVLTDGGSTDIKISRVAGSTNSRNAGRIKQTNASSKKMAFAQVIETGNSYPFRQKQARFQATVKASAASTDVRIAVLEWTGTADTLSTSRDVVNNWANSADADPATTFFKSTSFNVLGHEKVTIGTSFQQIGVNVNVGSSANNLIVVIWTEDAMAQNAYLDVTEAGLYVETTTPVIWTPVPISDEQARCNRYYQKSYNSDHKPGTNTIYGCTPPARAFDVSNLVGSPFTTIMRTSPTVSIYSISGNINKITEWPNANENSGVVDAVYYASPRGFVYVNSANDFNTTTPYFYHWVADAEL